MFQSGTMWSLNEIFIMLLWLCSMKILSVQSHVLPPDLSAHHFLLALHSSLLHHLLSLPCSMWPLTDHCLVSAHIICLDERREASSWTIAAVRQSSCIVLVASSPLHVYSFVPSANIFKVLNTWCGRSLIHICQEHWSQQWHLGECHRSHLLVWSESRWQQALAAGQAGKPGSTAIVCPP